MQILEVSGAVRHIYIYVIRQLKVNNNNNNNYNNYYYYMSDWNKIMSGVAHVCRSSCKVSIFSVLF